MVHSLLEDATAYVGTDLLKESIGNYFPIDLADDDVQVQASIDFIDGLHVSEGNFVKNLTIHGNLATSAVIVLCSYIHIEIIGKITLDANSDCHVFFADTETEITICGGGEIDPNGVNQGGATNIDGLLFVDCTEVTMYSLKIGGAHRNTTNGENVEFDGCTDCTVSDCRFYSYSTSYDVIKFTACVTCIAQGNHIDSTATNTSGAIQLHNGNNNIVIGNTIKVSMSAGALSMGIKLHHDDQDLIIGNTVLQARNNGISLIDTSSYNLVIGNYLFDMWETGINVNEATGGNIGYYNTIKDNEIFMEGGYVGVARGIRITTSGDHTQVFDNTVHGNAVVGNDVGLVIYAGADDTIVGRNRFYNFSDVCTNAGTNTLFEQLVFPFVGVQGAATFESTGIEVDADTQGAYAYYFVPYIVQKVMNMKITGKANVGDPDGMRLKIDYFAGADNEVITTHQESLLNQSSTTKNFAINDGIQWDVATVTLQAITGGDHLTVHITHEAAGGDDEATDCRFQAVVLDIV